MRPNMSGSLLGLRAFPALGHRRRGALAHSALMRRGRNAQGPTGSNQAKTGARRHPNRGIPEYCRAGRAHLSPPPLIAVGQ